MAVSPTIKFHSKQSDDGSESSDSQSELQKQNTNIHSSKINDNQSETNSSHETVEEKSAKKPRKKRISRALFRHDTIDYIKPKKQELLQNNFSHKFKKLVDKSKGIYSENEEQGHDDEVDAEKNSDLLDTTKTVRNTESNNNMPKMQHTILDMPSLDSPNTGKTSIQHRNDNKIKNILSTPINITVEVSQKAKNNLENIALQNAQITNDQKSSQLQYKYVGIVPRQNTIEEQMKPAEENLPQYTITIVPDTPNLNVRDKKTVLPPNYPVYQPPNNTQYKVVESQPEKQFPHNIKRYPYQYPYYPYPIIPPPYGKIQQNKIWNPMTTENSNKYNIENLIHNPQNATITTQNSTMNYKVKHNLPKSNYIQKPVAQNKNYTNIISNEMYTPKLNSNHTITKPQVQNISSINHTHKNYTLDRDKIVGANLHYTDNKTENLNCTVTKEPTNHKMDQIIIHNAQKEQSTHQNLHTVQNILHRNVNYIPVREYHKVNLQQSMLPNQHQGQKRNSEQGGSKINYKRVRFDSNLPTKNSLSAINYPTCDNNIENTFTSNISETVKNISTESVIVSPKEKKSAPEQVIESTENNKIMQNCSVIKKISSQNKNPHTIENILSIKNPQHKNEINNNNTIIEPSKTVINFSEAKKIENEPIVVDLTTEISENNSDKDFDRPMPPLIPVPKGYLNRIIKQDQHAKNYALNVPYIKPAHGYEKPIQTNNDILPLNLSLKESDKINTNCRVIEASNEQTRQSIIVNNIKIKDPLDLSKLTFVQNEEEYNNNLKILKDSNAVGPYLFYNFITSVRKRNNQPIFDLVSFFSLLKQGKLLEYKNMYMQHNK